MSTLSGKVAIVTGASSGIGRATARLFAAEGAAVVATARREEELQSLVAGIRAAGGEAVALPGDIREESHVKALTQIALDSYGRLDIAFNNAGTLGTPGAVTELPVKEWDHVLRTNLTSAFLCARHQLPAMLAQGSGSLVFTSSFVGYTVGFPGVAAYAASKAGLIGLVQSLAAEYGSQGIRVNALLPGGTDTPMGEVFANTPEAMAFVEGLHALKRRAAPEEIARSALHLASDASSFITGSAMLVDGGVSINRM